MQKFPSLSLLFILCNLILFGCKKSKINRGIDIYVVDCNYQPKNCTLIIIKNGQASTLNYTGSTISYDLEKNETIKIGYIYKNDTIYESFTATSKDRITTSKQLCDGLNMDISSYLNNPNQTAFSAGMFYENNYTIAYNQANNSTYIIGSKSALKNKIYPYIEGDFVLKIKNMNLSQIFSSTPFTIEMNSDTTDSYLAINVYSEDTVIAKNKYYLFNPNGRMDFSLSPGRNNKVNGVLKPFSSFNAANHNKPFGQQTGGDVLEVNLSFTKP